MQARPVANGRIPPQPRIQQGSIIALSISLGGTAYLFDDICPQVREALEQLTTKKYLGLVIYSDVHRVSKDVDMRDVGPDDPPPIETTLVRYVSINPPTDGLYPYIKSEIDVSQLCVPIAIASPSADGRSPLKISSNTRPFPFPELVAFTNIGSRLAVEYIHGGSEVWRLEAEDYRKYRQYAKSDEIEVNKAFERVDKRRRATEEECFERLEEAEVESARTSSVGDPAERPMVPTYELIYDVWFDLEDLDDIEMNTEEHDQEEKLVKKSVPSSVCLIYHTQIVSQGH